MFEDVGDMSPVYQEQSVLREQVHPADTYHLRDFTVRDTGEVRVEDAVTVADRQYHVCEVLRMEPERVDRLRRRAADASTFFSMDRRNIGDEYVVPVDYYHAVSFENGAVKNVTGEEWPENGSPDQVDGIAADVVTRFLHELELLHEFGVLITDITEDMAFAAAEYKNSEEHGCRVSPGVKNVFAP